MKKETAVTRRHFLQGSSLAAGAAAISVSAWGEEAAKPKEGKPKILNQQEGMAYRRLGNTDVYLSVISLGGLAMDPAGNIYHYSVEKGANLIHACLGYMGGRSIETVGKTMKTDRDKVYLALKDDFSRGSLESALKILNTDHVDFIMFNRHSPDSAKDTRIREQFENWKKEGKVRFSGLTTHDRVKETTAAGIDSGMFNIVMPALDQSQLEAMAEELRTAKEKNVGVMAMKSMKGMRDLELQSSFVKKLLKNPGLTTITKGFNSFEMFDAYAKAAKETLTSSEDWKLYKYAQATRNTNCMMCGQCVPECPNHIAISSMLRSSDYYFDQCGDVELARATYAEIPSECRAESCEECGRCEKVCPNRIAIRERLALCRSRLAALV